MSSSGPGDLGLSSAEFGRDSELIVEAIELEFLGELSDHLATALVSFFAMGIGGL